jgi:DNA-binding NtrC family response regulator
MEVERQTITEALEAEGGNQTRAAKRLGIPRRTLVYKLTQYRRKEGIKTGGRGNEPE